MLETFGRYQLIKKLATGGMGQVYLARQKGPVGFEKLVVVKRILPHLTEDEDFIAMFFDEARIAALLNHPNITQIYDLGEVEGVYFIAMEYVHGDSLRAVNTKANTQKGGMPLGLKLRVIADAAAGLDFAHRAKGPTGEPLALIHRDVSPQNVLVGFNGGVKLIDFGVAKAAGKRSTTLTGAIKGKYAYMSPEQARGEDLDSRSDVFGLGIVFYELLTSTRLFKRESETLTLKAVVGAKVTPPSAVVKTLPKALDAIVLKALAKKRTERFQTAGELQLALEDFFVRQRIPATMAHLSAFMRELYEKELGEEKLEIERSSGGDQHTPNRHASTSRSSPLRTDVSRSKSEPASRSASASRPSRATPGGPISTPSGRSSKLVPDPAELAARRAQLQTSDTTRGVLFNSVLRTVSSLVNVDAEAQVREAGGVKAYDDGKPYPTADFLGLLWKAAAVIAPTTASASRAFSELGGGCLESLVAGPAGKALEQTTAQLDPQWMLAPLMALIDSVVPGGGRKVEETTQQSAILVFKREPLPSHFHSGLISRAFERLKDTEARVDADRRVTESTTFHVRWD